MKNNFYLLLATLSLWAVSATAKEVKVKVLDQSGRPVGGAVVSVEGTDLRTYTDNSGHAVIEATESSLLGVEVFNKYYQTVRVEGDAVTVKLSRADELLSLGYDRQVSSKYATMAASGASNDEIEVTRGPLVMNSLIGLIPGLHVSKSGNLPGDSPAVYVRGRGSFQGNSVLFLVDGIERLPQFISTEEVESVTVLKDAASIAIYGNRGADGVVLITTKRGGDHPLRINTDYNFGISTPFAMPEMADGLTYANAVNEALANDGLQARYTQKDLSAIASGSSLFPSVDWKSEVLRKTAFSHNFNISFDGAESKVRYYVLASYDGYKGLFNNTDVNDGYSTQYESSQLRLRTNLEADMTRTTKLRINMSGLIRQIQQPYAGTYVSSIYTTPAIAFPVMNDNGVFARSELFGNPYAEYTQRGYSVSFQRMLLADIAVEQDLAALTKGLKLTVKGAFDNNAVMNDNHSKTYKYSYLSYGRDTEGNVDELKWSDYGNDTDLSFGSSLASGSSVYTSFSITGQLDYKRSFRRHNVAAAAIWSMDRWKNRGQNSVWSYNDFILRGNYDFAHRYLVDIVATCSGSAFLEDGKKYRFYPAVSAAWLISEEDFLQGASNLGLLKLRASYGITGYDARLGYGLDTPNNGSGGGFISMIGKNESGMMQGAYPSYGALPETDYKIDAGLDINAFGGLDISVDYFYNHRKNIKVASSGIISSILGLGTPYLFTGETINRGAEAEISWNQTIGNFHWHIGGTFSYAMSRIEEMGEEYHPYDYMYRTGNSITSYVLYETDGLYQESDFDAAGNLLPGYPVSTLDGKAVQPGDIKYVDQNGDGIIDTNDKKYMDNLHSLPSAFYGIQLGFKWKGLGLEADFNGEIGRTVQLTTSSVYWPLYNNDKNISMHYYNNRWTQETPDAKYPRLTTLSNGNDFNGGADFWTAKADYFKLRSLYVYYGFSGNSLSKARIRELTVFFRGLNLFSVDGIDIFDPESITLGYPSTRSLSLGLKLTF